MTDRPPNSSKPASARPEMTSALMEATGLDEKMLETLVHRFYERVRADELLGPIFEERVESWKPHLDRMVAFWSSVALMTGRYHGAPMPTHATLPVSWEHFERWLELFRQTARETCPPKGAAHVIERAERIARSLHLAVEDLSSRDGSASSNAKDPAP